MNFNIFKREHSVAATNALVEEIHKAFNTEGDRLLNEAKEILSKNLPTHEAEIASRLSKLGFSSAAVVKKVENDSKLKKVSEELAKLIEYYKFTYPQQRFITEESVDRLLEKYNLYKGDVSDYIGSVPLTNLVEIENFKLKEEDHFYYWYDHNWIGREITYSEALSAGRTLHVSKDFFNLCACN